MKVKTLSKEALAKMTGNLSSKPDQESDTDAVDTEVTLKDGETVIEDLTDGEETEDTQTEPNLLEELKEKYEALESDHAGANEQLAAVNETLETKLKDFEESEKLVANLSEGLRGVVNSMKISMGHVELDDSVVGEAILKEYEFTSNKFMESMPTGSLVPEPETTNKTKSAVPSLASAADYKNMPWSK